ncbi:extracellular catalytic domain type 1 short-chain-length polyhydroxyalkanoate depolymerase [Pseudoduganella sp. OTU4001]|uniref:extracellular catalytic domain type 1 short-chain-length polyhydroxyalkanoate depolymerase n=1 Tax=Pseudoduganella sp. OTU4001 TaxID=3043854 RepID=UPI00313D8B3E
MKLDRHWFSRALGLLARTRLHPPAASEPQFSSGNFHCRAGSRRYKLFVPSGYTGQPLPLLVMLHGCQQDPDDFAAGTQMNAVAQEHGCLVLYPAQSQEANQARCWNWFSALDQERGQGEPAIIAAMARDIMARYPVRQSQVFIAGLSAGGAMAVIVGTLYPDLFAAVGVHSGLPFAAARDLPSALYAMRLGAANARAAQTAGQPIIVFHGDRDSTVHPANGEEVLAQGLRSHPQGGSANPATLAGQVPDGHAFTLKAHWLEDGSPLGEHWVIHGAGHAWSGGSAAGSYTDPRGPDASREMMRFFSAARNGAQNAISSPARTGPAPG